MYPTLKIATNTVNVIRLTVAALSPERIISTEIIIKLTINKIFLYKF